MNPEATMPDWRDHGVKIIPGAQLDLNTPQTPGMTRAAAITHARTGASKLWAGAVTINANAKTAAHHHGELESVIYVVSGRARMRWGEHLEFVAEAEPGDFIYVPPFVPHQEINASKTEVLACVVVCSGQEPIVIILVIETPEPPRGVLGRSRSSASVNLSYVVGEEVRFGGAVACSGRRSCRVRKPLPMSDDEMRQRRDPLLRCAVHIEAFPHRHLRNRFLGPSRL